MNTTFTQLRATKVSIRRACTLIGRSRATHYRHAAYRFTAHARRARYQPTVKPVRR